MSSVEELTEEIYTMYGSGTGVLFGIPANLRSSVQAIVKIVLECKEKEK